MSMDSFEPDRDAIGRGTGRHAAMRPGMVHVTHASVNGLAEERPYRYSATQLPDAQALTCDRPPPSRLGPISY